MSIIITILFFESTVSMYEVYSRDELCLVGVVSPEGDGVELVEVVPGLAGRGEVGVARLPRIHGAAAKQKS